MGCHNWQKVSDRRWCKRWIDLYDVGKEELFASNRNTKRKFGALRSHKCQV